tara:strand:- start:88 stop:804 length:717 start_codon:yes stop_codon:yes gene_type:complete
MSQIITNRITKRRIFGRSKGKKLSQKQQEYFDKFSKTYSLFNNGISGGLKPKLKKLLGVEVLTSNVVLEVGFGSGEHIVLQAKKMPNTFFIGCEQYKNGVAKLLGQIDVCNISNIAIHYGDARDALDNLPNNCIDKFYLLFPDPWPKKKHASRRFINKENLDQISRVLKCNGLLYIASDIEEYSAHVLEHIFCQKDFLWTAQNKNDWSKPWDSSNTTRYEQKAILEGRVPHYLVFKKR